MTKPKLNEKQMQYEEIAVKTINGMAVLILGVVFAVGSIFGLIYSLSTSGAISVIITALAIVFIMAVGPILFLGLKILKPNEAMVFTLFGKYHGTLKGEGFFFVNPFAVTVESSSLTATSASLVKATGASSTMTGGRDKKISLKAMTLNNERQKINDVLGNPIVIGIVVVWRVVNTAKAAFNIDNYTEFLSIQCDSSLRNIVRQYPYDIACEDYEKSLRGSSQEVADVLKEEIQQKVDIAGLEIIEARISHLSYAPEIAAAMLQRQQASAVIDARQMIVEGAVGMVQMALDKLTEGDLYLDEERKAAMVSNLLVVLCGNKDAQPVVNTGSIY